jgi:hypothetical protein
MHDLNFWLEGRKIKAAPSLKLDQLYTSGEVDSSSIVRPERPQNVREFVL